MRRRPSMSEWVALWLDIGYRHAPQVLRESGHNWGPIPNRDYVDAAVALAQLDKTILDQDFARLTDAAKQADNDLVHIDAVSGMVSRSRRTVETRIRDRRVSTVKVDGRTFIRAEDIDKLRDEK